MRDVTNLNQYSAEKRAAQDETLRQRLIAHVAAFTTRVSGEFPGPPHQYALAVITEPYRALVDAHEAQSPKTLRTALQSVVPPLSLIPEAPGGVIILDRRSTFDKGIFDDETQRHLPSTQS
jgi:hypothetical protein